MSLIQKAIERHHSEQITPGTSDRVHSRLDLNSVLGTVTPIRQNSDSYQAFPDQAVVEINQKRLESFGFAVPGAKLSQVTTQFRRTKRPLLLNVAASSIAESRRMRRIMIASALPGEGKTYCALNLALSLANEKDYSVLLVDADFPKPSIHKTLGLPKAAGIIDALEDPHVDIESLIQPTSISNLSILGPGNSHPEATEMLASQQMQALSESLTLRDPHRIVIFDSPPLLVTTEAAELSRLMGQIALVVSTGVTPRSAIAGAIDLLGSAKAETSILMNRFPRRKGADKYSYGYKYGGYGKGYGG